MLKRNSSLLLALTVATPLLFAACTDNNIFNPMQDFAGTYQLTVYAGHGMPNATFVIQAGDPNFPTEPNGGTFVVTDGDIVLDNNGTFVETNNFVITATGGSTRTDRFVSNGTWSLSGSSFTLNAPFQNSNPARFATGTLITSGNADILNYQEDNGGGLQSYEYRR